MATCGIVLAAWWCFGQIPLGSRTRVIEVLADKDSRYKIAGEKIPEISVKVGAVSYTHLDVYKRQPGDIGSTRERYCASHRDSMQSVNTVKEGKL